MRNELICGVLGVQGDYERHIAALRRAGADARLVRFPDEIALVDSLVMPGGESTTFTILFEKTGLWSAIAGFIKSGRPVWGTCAGAIMLGSEVAGDDQNVTVKPLCAVDTTVSRNAFGRQVDSFEAEVTLDLPGGRSGFTGVFIRAPRFVRIGNGVSVLGRLGVEPVMIEQDNVMLTSFHPELTGDERIHDYFLSKARVKSEVLR